jgi:hypothetical protein
MAYYSAKLWATIKAALESGEYGSIIKLHAEMHKKYTKFPSVEAIKRKGFEKAKDKPAIEKSIQEKNIEMLARAGATREKAAQTLAGMLDATKTTIINDGNPKTRAEANGEPQGFVQEAPDYQARDKGLIHFYKLVGDYAAEKVEFVTPDTLRQFVIGVAQIVAKYVSDDVKINCLNEIALLMEKIDNGKNNCG